MPLLCNSSLGGWLLAGARLRAPGSVSATHGQGQRRERATQSGTRQGGGALQSSARVARCDTNRDACGCQF